MCIYLETKTIKSFNLKIVPMKGLEPLTPTLGEWYSSIELHRLMLFSTSFSSCVFILAHSDWSCQVLIRVACVTFVLAFHKRVLDCRTSGGGRTLTPFGAATFEAAVSSVSTTEALLFASFLC